MPRKDFLRDFAEVQQTTFRHIAAIETGTETGEFSFAYVSDLLPAGSVVIQSLLPEVSAYPSTHEYMLFIQNDEDVPASVSGTLESLAPLLAGQTLRQMLEQVSTALHNRLSQGKADNPLTIDDEVEEDEASLDGDAISVAWSEEHFHTGPNQTSRAINKKTDHFAPSNTPQQKIRSDLQATKDAGFRVGILGDLSNTGIVCVSIRVRKLGISEEAMQAWGLRRKQYLVLLIKFQGGYRTLEQIKDDAQLVGRTEMRVGLCDRYKPALSEALNAFMPVGASEPDEEKARAGDEQATLLPLFIGRPINDLLAHRFAGIVKFRLGCGYGWMGAEEFINDTQAKAVTSEDVADPKYFQPETSEHRWTLPDILTADSIGDGGPPSDLALPLVAMQFVLRHLVRCTDFCLVCHCKIQASFEALKPYVCSKPLCLYQYMALGFGPSIEWEIATQPYVVDVLVSFCYASAQSGRLRDFPTGIALRVPMLPDFTDPILTYTGYGSLPPPRTAPVTQPTPPVSFPANLHQDRSELIFDVTRPSPVRVGDWIVVQGPTLHAPIHYRVQEVRLFPTVRLDGQGITVARETEVLQVVRDGRFTTPTPAPSPAPPVPATATPGLISVECFLYDQNFDDLETNTKQHCIMMLLDTLPSILHLRAHLLQHGLRQDMSLKGLRGELSDSALNLLRWIIASNRSCIMQVDKIAEKHQLPGMPDTFANANTLEDRVSGMDSYMQFRFAQGAPDKEQRFINCVNELAAQTGHTQYPTLFTWHGSPLGNWHSIIREGLHFNETLHGRAYGNGVYMSQQCTTSTGYSGTGHYHGTRATSKAGNWCNSDLQISSALSLNEVVNAPAQYVSTAPHLVVDKIDWIQTRYLFVLAAGKCHSPTPAPSAVYQQDPAHSASDEKGQKIIIPITAVSKSRRPALQATAQQVGDKKVKSMGTTDQQTAENAEDDADSVLTNPSDRQYLESDDDELDDADGDAEDDDGDIDADLGSPMSIDHDAALVRKGSKRAGDALEKTIPSPPSARHTDFVPGTLDLTTLQILKPPEQAAVTTTRTLMKTLHDTLKVQESTAPHELGWYIDGAAISNMYQWIVELHSFDPTLQLAKDMKAANLTSIVLEMRFTNNFPFSPPFVRVIKPRFVPFLAGGGGHVTAGGAICMELLTNNGWLVTNTIESLLMQVRLELCSTDPPARLERRGAGGHNGSYGIHEAIEAYKRACLAHGWTVPADFDTLQKE